MIYLKLFLYFLEVGTVSFGGGYGMISLIRDIVLSQNWLTEGELMDLVAISESTPGPLAVNMATFVGATKGGFFGALMATFGVVLPAFVVIVLISSVMKKAMEYAGVKHMLDGIRPCIIALIISTALIFGLKNLMGISLMGDSLRIDKMGVWIFAVLVAVDQIPKRLAGRKISPIILIIVSAILGVILF